VRQLTPAGSARRARSIRYRSRVAGPNCGSLMEITSPPSCKVRSAGRQIREDHAQQAVLMRVRVRTARR
jgi:hypothetical protein